MADKRKFSDDEFDDIDLTEEEIEYLNISFDDTEETAGQDDIYVETENEDYNNPGKRHKFLIPVLILIIAVCVVAAVIIVKNTPSKVKVDLYEYYGVQEGSDKLAIAVNHKKADIFGYVIGDRYYIPEEIVEEYLTDKLYVDKKNSRVLYTTELKIWEIPFGESYYTVEGDTTNKEYPIVKYLDEKIYVCIDFLKELTGCDYYFYESPSRIAIETAGSEYIVMDAAAGIKVRTDATIKADIIGTVTDESRWYILDGKKGEWQMVISDDARAGYVKSKDINTTYAKKTTEFISTPYKNQVRDHKIILVWDGIYVKEENAGIESRLENVTSANVISPTWYKVTDSDGSIESMADREYIEYVKSKGLEIWPLINDFSAGAEDGFDEAELLSNTESRRNLINNLMSEVAEYGYDGINIDFEKIKSAYGKDFIQFIRELSIECRKAEIVLSVDNYVPFSFNEFYGRKAQNECVDYVIVMCYDEHYDGGESSGSTASIGYVKMGAERTLESVDKEKLIVGVPFYSRLWQSEINAEDNSTSILGTKAYSMNGGEQIAEELGLVSEWDDELKQTVATGYSGGYFYEIWLETLQSMTEKINTIRDYDVGGISAWALGFEDDGVWDIFSKINS